MTTSLQARRSFVAAPDSLAPLFKRYPFLQTGLRLRTRGGDQCNAAQRHLRMRRTPSDSSGGLGVVRIKVGY